MLGGQLHITTASAESLPDAIQQAITTHPSVTSAQAAREASAQGVREQRSAYFPELSANITGGRIYGDNATSRGLSVTRGAGYSGVGEGSASLTQRIYDWGETGNKVDAAKARDHAAQSQITGTRETIALRAAQAYIGLLRAAKVKDASAQNLQSIEAYQQKIATQVKEGGSDEAELNRANDFLLLAQNAATEFEGQYQQALADYQEATGGKPVSALKRPGLPAHFPATVEAAVKAALDSHPQIASARESIVAAGHDIEAESTSYLPKINGQMSYLKRDQADIIGGEVVDARAVVKADWNYSTGGAQLARVARAEAGKAQAQAQLDETLRRVERDVRVAWSALEVVRKQEKTQADRKTATSRVVETYKTQYEGGGQRKLIELMQAESQAFDAGVAYDNADFGELNAAYTLLAAMGGLIDGLKQPLVEDARVDLPATETAAAVSSVAAVREPAAPVPAGSDVKNTFVAEDLLRVPSTSPMPDAAPVVPPVQKSISPSAVASVVPAQAPVTSPSAEDVLLVPSMQTSQAIPHDNPVTAR